MLLFDGDCIFFFFPGRVQPSPRGLFKKFILPRPPAAYVRRVFRRRRHMPALEDGFADEADNYEAIVASERIASWLLDVSSLALADVPVSRITLARRKALRALQALQTNVESSSAYAEEARIQDVSDRMTRALVELSKCEEDANLPASAPTTSELTDAVSAVITALAGPGAAPPRTRTVSVAGTSVVVEEGALAEGLGARLWRAALLLCESSLFRPMIKNANVLELGAGVGLSGICAARLEASRVVLTDCEASVLEILDRNCDANRDACLPCSLEVAYLQWSDDAATESTGGNGWEAETPAHPTLKRDEVFDAVIAADFVYDDAHSDLIPAVLARRMKRPGGVGLLLAAVRQEELLEALLRHMSDHKLEAKATRFQLDEHEHPEATARVNEARAMFTPDERAYQGGFVQICVWHQGEEMPLLSSM